MKTISFKQTESALFNLDSLRTKLYVQQSELAEVKKYAEADALDERIEEVEDLLGKMKSGRVTRKEWARIQELVAERRMQRYTTCLNSGMDESVAAGALDD